jgi:multidrug efflux pump
MLCARFLKSHDESSHGRVYRATESAFQWMHSEYARGLRWVLRHQALMLCVLIATFAFNIYLYIIVPKGFFPQQDTGRISGSTRASQDISFPAMSVKQRELAQMVLDDPAILTVTAFAGGGGPGGGSSNVGRMFIALKPLAERPGRVTADQVVNRLRRKLTSVPGAVLYLQANQDIQVGGRGSDAQYQYTLADENLNELNAWAPQLQARMKTMPELRDVSTDQQNQGLAANLVIDRRVAPRHHRQRHRQRALRRLRPAPGLHHVHRAQPVPRGDGGRSPLPAQPRLAKRHLHQSQQCAGRHHRHGLHQRHFHCHRGRNHFIHGRRHGAAGGHRSL